ncbi:hypothetical protein BTVI_97122 [Pitangus sulphuratus]|nr:hypothetical protein BTVI_97122 [Pitangus sulphuratus]
MGPAEGNEDDRGTGISLLQGKAEEAGPVQAQEETTEKGYVGVSVAPHSLVSSCKLAESALNPTVYIIDGDIEEHQYLRDTPLHQPPPG